MTEESTYELVMVFLDESPSFCYGYECGMIDADMKHGDVIEGRTVHAPNRQQVEMIANKNNYSTEWSETTVSDWLYLNAKPNEGPNKRREELTVVDGGLA